MEAIWAGALDLTVIVKRSELPERKAFVETLVKEIVVMLGNALIRYNVPMHYDSRAAGTDSDEVLMGGSGMSAAEGVG